MPANRQDMTPKSASADAEPSAARSPDGPLAETQRYHRPCDELAAYFETRCNRYTNGGCSVHRCVARGRRLYEQAGLAGRLPLMSPKEIAHCEEWDAAKLIRALMDEAARATGPSSPQSADDAPGMNQK